jgi:ADP-ribose pyrophosphatase YjhB (NUDIX family)
VELGETLRAATEREALEETGLIVEAGAVLEVLDRIIPGDGGAPQYHYVLVDFLCRKRGGELQAGSDVAGVAWATEDELSRYDLEAIVIQVAKKALEQQIE